jgi:hypothetical protein
MKKTLILATALATAITSASAQMSLTRNGKPTARIVADTTKPIDKEAAEILELFVSRISGAHLPIVAPSTKLRSGDIVIGKGSTDGLTEDGFRLRTTQSGTLEISSGGDKGLIYGAITLLENYLGVDYFAADSYTFTPTANIVLPNIDDKQNPAFRFRQVNNYGYTTDSLYRRWMRAEDPDEEFAGNLWVHTFNHLLPADEYGKDHPEYYAYINGERRPGRASQWCLNNDELFEIVAARIDSIFEANPQCKTISVSQNDGNFTNCHCEKCEAVDQYEGALSGNFVRFVNRLAERRPDKQFSTLAYLFTMQPPKHVKPLPNVNIMLCDIDCKREVPLTDNASGQDFMKAIEGWSKITNNIYVWDYGINFDNYLSPFPNFPILQKNIQIFKEHGATMHHSQIASSRGGDFSEMRTYMVSKLMWNPYLDADSLMHHFMDGYYGAAAPYIYQYEKMLEGALLASDKELWIYDSPITHKDGMLNAKCRKRYNELFDQAEAAVANDNVLLKRVRMTRLPLQYSELEFARKDGLGSAPETVEKLKLFEQRTAEYDIEEINERHNTPAEYCALYKSRYMNQKGANLAANAQVTWIVPPTGRYANMNKDVTDELFGGTTYVESWVGWEGIDGSFVIDLGEDKQFSSVSTDFLHQLGAWILLPKSVSYYTSTNGKDYTLMGKAIQEEDRTPAVKFVELSANSQTPITARYIKVEVEGVKTCPGWHYGVGYPAWFFLDEVTVK